MDFRNRSHSRNRNESYDTRGRSRDRNNRRREESMSQSNSRVSTNHDDVRCYRCQEYDHFVAECPNTPTDEETDYEDADLTSLQMMVQSYSPDKFRKGSRLFKLVKGRNDSTPFLPSKVKTGGKVMYIQNKEAMCLTERQTDHVYKGVEEGIMINTKTATCESMTCEPDQCQDDNPYKRVVLNNVYKEPDISPEMKSWSIFSDNVRYVQHDQMTSQNLNIDTLDYRDHKDLYLKLKEEE